MAAAAAEAGAEAEEELLEAAKAEYGLACEGWGWDEAGLAALEEEVVDVVVAKAGLGAAEVMRSRVLQTMRARGMPGEE